MDQDTIKLTNVLLREESSQTGSLRVDRENNVIFGVKLLGNTSKNKHPVSGKPYRYTDNALKGFADLQEGARVFLDHQKTSDGGPRSYADQLGDVRSVTASVSGDSKGTFGNLHYNPKHPLIEQILHDAEHAPHRLAMSHVATGAGRPDGDWHLVEEAKAVASVDIVTHGATNVSLYEQSPATLQEEVNNETDTKMDELREENEALKARVGELENQISLHEAQVARMEREKQIADSGVKVEDDELREHLLSSDEKTASLILKNIKVAESAQAPKSRDPGNTGRNNFSSTDDFVNALGGN